MDLKDITVKRSGHSNLAVTFPGTQSISERTVVGTRYEWVDFAVHILWLQSRNLLSGEGKMHAEMDEQRLEEEDLT